MFKNGGTMKSPFLLVFLIILIPMAQLLIPIMVGIVVLAAIFSIFKEAIESLEGMFHRKEIT